MKSIKYSDYPSSEEGTGWKKATVDIKEQFINGFSYTIRDRIHETSRE